MQADPHHSSPRRWMPIIGIAGGLMAAVVVTFVVLLERGLTPPHTIVDLTAISDSQFDHLVDAEIVRPNESIVMLCSTGMISIDESGAVLTEDRVVHYVCEDDEHVVRSIDYDHVNAVTVLERGNQHRPTLVDIQTTDGRHVRMFVSAGDGGDQRFIDEIRRRIPPWDTEPLVTRDSTDGS